MHFSSLFVAAVAATLASAAAVPAAEADCNRITCEKGGFHITEFHGSSNPNDFSAEYHFFVQGRYDVTGARSFPKTKCHVGLHFGEKHRSLLPVGGVECDNPDVTFDFIKSHSAGQFDGWNLTVYHFFEHRSQGQLSGFADIGTHHIPKEDIKTREEGQKEYQYVAASHRDVRMKPRLEFVRQL